MITKFNAKKININKKTLKKYAFAYGILIYPLALFAVFYLYVNVNSFVMAFQNYNLDGTKTFAGLSNFTRFIDGLAASGGLISISFTNSLTMYFLNLCICMPLYILFSYLLYKQFRGHNVIRTAVMLPSIISSFVFCLVFKNFAGKPLQDLMRDCGFASFPNLIFDSKYAFGTTLFYMIWVSFSTSLIVYPNAMNAIDPAIIESSKIDGVTNMFQEIWYIILPMIFPTITTFLVTGFSTILSNSGPLLAFFRYDAPPQAFNLGYYMLVEIVRDPSSEIGFPLVAAGGLLITIIVAPLTVLLRNFLEKINPVQDA